LEEHGDDQDEDKGDEQDEDKGDDQDEERSPLDQGDSAEGFDPMVQIIQMSGGSLQLAGRDINNTTINYNYKDLKVPADGERILSVALEGHLKSLRSTRVPKCARLALFNQLQGLSSKQLTNSGCWYWPKVPYSRDVQEMVGERRGLVGDRNA
jgi:hypothetical protein